MSTEYSWHAIAVGNRLLGLYNFVVLTTPPGWRVVVMPMASEVFRHREVNGVKWVRDGEVTHFLQNGEEAYRLEIVVKPGRRRLEGDYIAVNSHEGRYRVRERGGRYRLEVSYYCPETDRTIEISIEGLRELSILRHLGYSQCH
ncbi:MAG: hypothetical protein ACK4M3_07425 [Pyrobaculum sp.]